MEASNCCQRRAAGDWGLNRGGGGCPFFLSLFLSPSFFVNGFHSLFLSVSHSWRARLCQQGMGTREPGSDRMTLQHLAVCRRFFSLRYFPLLLFCFGFSLSFSPFPARQKNKKVSPSISGKTKSVRCTKCKREKKEQDLFMEKINVFVQGIKRELKRERERGSSLIARRRKYKSPLFFLLFYFSAPFCFSPPLPLFLDFQIHI